MWPYEIISGNWPAIPLPNTLRYITFSVAIEVLQAFFASCFTFVVVYNRLHIAHIHPKVLYGCYVASLCGFFHPSTLLLFFFPGKYWLRRVFPTVHGSN